MVSVDHSRGRPVRAGGSIASMVASRRIVAFARTASSIAGAERRRRSGVQDIFGVPYGKAPMWAADSQAGRRSALPVPRKKPGLRGGWLEGRELDRVAEVGEAADEPPGLHLFGAPVEV